MFDALRTLVGTFGQHSHTDSWFNQNTGLGVVGMDRAAGIDFSLDPYLDVITLAGLYHTNALCRTIVELFPEEALRRPYKFVGPQATELTEFAQRLELKQKLKRGCTWGRLFGGGLGVLWIDDGLPSDQPLKKDANGDPLPVRIRDLTIYDKRSILRRQRFENPGDLLFADARVFEVFPPYGGSFHVHRDRCLVFEGVETANYEREQLAGWWLSALQAPMESIQQYQQGFLSLSNMLTDASQAVITMSGLIEALTEKDGPNLISTRAQIMNLSRSVARAIFLDAGGKDGGGEKFEKVKTDFASVPDAIDRLAYKISGDTRIPVTKLIGRSPAGLNATGDSDTRNWYEEVDAYRSQQVAPHVEYIVRLTAPGHTLEWPSLWEPTDKEAAETRRFDAMADKVYLDAQVYTPEEVALSRTGPRDVRFDPRLRRPMVAPASAPPGTQPPQLPPAPAATIEKPSMPETQTDPPKPGAAPQPPSMTVKPKRKP